MYLASPGDLTEKNKKSQSRGKDIQDKIMRFCEVNISVVSRQVFCGMGQIETRFEKAETGWDGIRDNENLIHSSKQWKRASIMQQKLPKLRFQF